MEIGENIEISLFMKNFKDLYTCMNITKYRSFQYRLLHRAIITNVHLFRWGMRKDNLCTFCHQQKESYSHLFVMCSKVQPIWIRLEELMSRFDSTAITFNVYSVITNTLINNIKNVKNFLCLLTKQYIYRKRCFSENPSYEQLESLIWQMKNIERFNAIKNNQEHKHFAKWSKNRPHIFRGK